MTDPDIEVKEDEKPKHPVVEKIKGITAFFQALTSKGETDNMWVLGIKYFFKGIIILILILLSPFVAGAILISVMLAG